MSKRVMITGANGFVGSALARAAQVNGWIVTGLVRRRVDELPGSRMCDYSVEGLRDLIAEGKPDFIAHAAGAASVGASISDPAGDFASSVGLTQRLLEAVRKSGHRPRLLYASSAAVYGNPASLPVAEDAALAPISPYGFHKLLCERLFEEYAACFGHTALCARAFSLLGEAQRRLLVWDIFSKARTSGDVELGGTGEESRDYLHVDDFARLCWLVAERSIRGFVPVNIASGRAVSVRQVAEGVIACVGNGNIVRFTGVVRPGDPKEWRADLSRLAELCGKPEFPAFEVRLAQVVRAWRH